MPVTAHPVVSLAKTTRPSRAGIIPRERLYALLDEARGSAAAWITGPPGCGKTTVAASYLEHRKLPALWYQLDEGDADVASFFYYLDAATNELARRKTPRLPQLAPEYHAGLPVFTRRYFQALYQRLVRVRLQRRGLRITPPYSRCPHCSPALGSRRPGDHGGATDRGSRCGCAPPSWQRC